MKTVKVTIYGEVTAVGFRYFIKQQALNLNLKGYVKNIQNKVEVVFEGKEEDINKMIELCKKGPVFAKITGIETKQMDYQHFGGFEIRCT